MILDSLSLLPHYTEFILRLNDANGAVESFREVPVRMALFGFN